jgi:hypothetical protein
MVEASGLSSDAAVLLSEKNFGEIGKSRHVSHVSEFPLAPSQRQSIIHALALNDGEVLAVNGPPGTGKTTMLHSLWSSLWVQAAIAGKSAPLIAVSSTNNQAITNVLDSLEKELKVDRWLPGVSSLGVYLAQEKKGLASGYFWQDIWAGRHSDIENIEYLTRAETTYLTRANDYFRLHNRSPVESLSGAVDALHQMLLQGSEGLRRAYTLCEKFAACAAKVAAVGEIDGRLSDLGVEKSNTSNRLAKAVAFEKAWLAHVANESWVLALLSFLPPIRAKQKALDAVCLAEFPSLGSIFKKMELPRDRQRLQSEIASYCNKLRAKAESISREEESLVKLAAELEARSNEVQDELLSLELRHGKDPSKWSPGQINDVTGDMSPVSLFDTTVRRFMFEIAVHYWEGRWIKEVFALNKINNKGTSRALWSRRAMLTPCMVTTMQSGPKYFQSWKRDQKIAMPDYRAIDCLIVDEAGQISPEVSGAMFALAKKAVVVGDCVQIQPVWNIPAYLDAANAAVCDIDDFSQIQAFGLAASSGSVMKIAQAASRYTLGPDYPRGMFLSEHRRCADPIIGYCNDLAYNGKIIPKKNRPWVKDDFPWTHFGYAHIDGEDVQPSSGSRVNDVEAETIAEWVSSEKDRILAYYQRSDLSSCLGIVTPFAAQGRRIRQALASRNVRIEKCGTVHGLQGAERDLILFSPVYSTRNPTGSYFFDNGPEMLNVAVSRAKDAFLVFGDMGIFSRQGSTPSAVLARKMFADERNEMPVKVIRPDLRDSRPEDHIRLVMGVEEHLDLLADVFETAKQHVTIVSPFMSDRAVVKYKTHGGRWPHGIPGKIRECVSRGVSVIVYADKDKLASHENDAALNAIKAAGADVRLLRNTHAKPIYADDTLFVDGSFNWLSGERIDNRYKQFEMSTVYRVRGGKDPLVPHITRSIAALESLRV